MNINRFVYILKKKKKSPNIFSFSPPSCWVFGITITITRQMLMVSTGTTSGLKMRKYEVANSKRISIATYIFARSSSLFAVASSNFRIQTYSLYRRKCKGGNASIGASSLSKSFRSTPLNIYAEQSGPKAHG